MKWFWTLFICCTASAQLPVIPYVVPNSSVTNFTGAEYVWISSDLTLNTAISGNWNDRIQTLAYKQGASTRQPTNSSSGIWFDSTHWLTNFMTVMGSNVAFGFIIKIIDPTGGSGTFPGMSGNDYAGADGSGRLDLRFNSTAATYNMATEQGSATPQPIGPVNKWSTTNIVFDLVYVQVMTNNNTGGFFCYTNGLLMERANLVQAPIASGNYFGSTAVQNSANGNLRFMFLNNSRSTSIKGYLLEHWIWTNAAPGAANGNTIDPTVLAAFHTRAMTYYGVTP